MNSKRYSFILECRNVTRPGIKVKAVDVVKPRVNVKTVHDVKTIIHASKAEGLEMTDLDPEAQFRQDEITDLGPEPCQAEMTDLDQRTSPVLNTSSGKCTEPWIASEVRKLSRLLDAVRLLVEHHPNHPRVLHQGQKPQVHVARGRLYALETRHALLLEDRNVGKPKTTRTKTKLNQKGRRY